MQVKTSKEVTDRQKATAFVQFALRVDGPAVADDMTTLFRPHFGPDEEPGFADSLSSSVRMLDATITDLVTADEAHYAEKAALAALLDERAEVTAALKRLLVGMRRIVLGQHPDVDLGRLGFGGETSREPLPLLRQGERILGVLDGDELGDVVGEPLFDAAVFNPQLYRDAIRQAVTALRSVLDRISEAQRRVERAYLAKKEKRKLHDRLFLREARGFADWCRLVGRDELAERIRPSASRPGRTEKEPPDETSASSLRPSSPDTPIASPRSPETPPSSRAPRGLSPRSVLPGS